MRKETTRLEAERTQNNPLIQLSVRCSNSNVNAGQQ